jgi:predicted nucleotidyltransferase
MPAIDISTQDKDLICKILKSFFPNVNILVFGSRIDGRAKPYSDLDIALDTGSKISLSMLSQIHAALAQTNIPFKVDITDLHSVSEDFKKHILGHNVECLS